MSDVHARILQSAENLYAGALQAFEDKRWWWAEMTAGAAMGAATFIAEDHETPEEMQRRGALVFKQALAVAEKARAAWVRQNTEARLSGRKTGHEIDLIGEYITAIVRASVV